MMLRSVRSAKSVAWIRLNVAGVRSCFFLPRLVVSFTSGRGVPLAEHHAIALGLEPLMQEHQLRGFAGAVDAFDNK